ncbi:hypothetical protein [Spirosoma rigui]|nr:hypothetical protein [Spirosoma rigui]
MIIAIPDELVEQANLSPDELCTDLAAYLYAHRRLALRHVRRLASMDLIA